MSKNKIAIIGQGYVGLPLAIEFGKRFKTIGFDIDQTRIEELKFFFDRTKEASSEMIKKSKKLSFTNLLSEIKDCNIYIITVPTPIDSFKTPDLNPIKSASLMIGGILKRTML